MFYLNIAVLVLFTVGVLLWLVSLLGKTPPTLVKHVKRGSVYEIVGTATIQTDIPLKDYDEVFVYRDPETEEIWVRRKSEFVDGRFEVLK